MSGVRSSGSAIVIKVYPEQFNQLRVAMLQNPSIRNRGDFLLEVLHGKIPALRCRVVSSTRSKSLCFTVSPEASQDISRMASGAGFTTADFIREKLFNENTWLYERSWGQTHPTARRVREAKGCIKLQMRSYEVEPLRRALAEHPNLLNLTGLFRAKLEGSDIEIDTPAVTENSVMVGTDLYFPLDELEEIQKLISDSGLTTVAFLRRTFFGEDYHIPNARTMSRSS